MVARTDEDFEDRFRRHFPRRSNDLTLIVLKGHLLMEEAVNRNASKLPAQARGDRGRPSTISSETMLASTSRSGRSRRHCLSTGITAYLKNGGTLEKAAAMANHAPTRTTQLYDRRRDELSLDEVERIMI